MKWSPALHIGTALEGAQDVELDAGGGGRWKKPSRRGEDPKLCRIFYLKCFLFATWLIGAFNIKRDDSFLPPLLQPR